MYTECTKYNEQKSRNHRQNKLMQIFLEAPRVQIFAERLHDHVTELESRVYQCSPCSE